MDATDKKRYYSWCLVINNYTDTHIERVEAFMENVCYGIYGKEVSETGTPHLQVYFRLKTGKTFSKIKKLFPTANIRRADGDDSHNFVYCSKEGELLPNFKQYGTRSNQGKRTDLDTIKNDIMEGKKVDDIVIETPTIYHQYGRTLHKIEDIRMRSVYRTQMTEGEWVYGTTGTGKSEYAFKDYNPKTHYVWKYDNGWNDGYAQQDIVIIDEFRGQMPMNELLMLIDKHPNAFVRRRGREPLPFVSKKVIITSSLPPNEVYKNLAENDKLDQLMRRLKIIEKTKDNIIIHNFLERSDDGF